MQDIKTTLEKLNSTITDFKELSHSHKTQWDDDEQGYDDAYCAFLHDEYKMYENLDKHIAILEECKAILEQIKEKVENNPLFNPNKDENFKNLSESIKDSTDRIIKNSIRYSDKIFYFLKKKKNK